VAIERLPVVEQGPDRGNESSQSATIERLAVLDWGVDGAGAGGLWTSLGQSLEGDSDFARDEILMRGGTAIARGTGPLSNWRPLRRRRRRSRRQTRSASCDPGVGRGERVIGGD
jgi:hypothetical protein